MRLILSLVIMISCYGNASAKCVGRFINPITDVCWECVFPITIGGLSLSSGEDTSNPSQPVCFCKDPPRVGIPISFWEPARMADVTRTPYCMVNLAGMQMGPNTGVKSRGSVGRSSSGAMKHSFYQVHWYVYPLLYWMELLTDFACMEKSEFDVAYLTELDPLWNDDETAFILNPEGALFGNPVAQAACAGDCVAASSGFSHDALFWCSGCQGSLYPFTGSVAAHSGPAQASALLVSRFIAKLHREGLAWGYTGVKGLCGKYPMPVIRKSQYKIQLTYPSPSSDCHPIGRSDLFWSSGKQFPYKGEDFGYLIWRKRNCCLL